jgi:hypothetical protein
LTWNGRERLPEKDTERASNGPGHRPSPCPDSEACGRAFRKANEHGKFLKILPVSFLWEPVPSSIDPDGLIGQMIPKANGRIQYWAPRPIEAVLLSKKVRAFLQKGPRCRTYVNLDGRQAAAAYPLRPDGAHLRCAQPWPCWRRGLHVHEHLRSWPSSEENNAAAATVIDVLTNRLLEDGGIPMRECRPSDSPESIAHGKRVSPRSPAVRRNGAVDRLILSTCPSSLFATVRPRLRATCWSPHSAGSPSP